MPTTKEQATKLTQDVADFLHSWGLAHCGGPIDASVGLSALGSLLAYTIAGVPDPEVRKGAFHSVIGLLTQNSDADVLVSVFDCPGRAADAMLATVRPQGRA